MKRKRLLYVLGAAALCFGLYLLSPKSKEVPVGKVEEAAAPVDSLPVVSEIETKPLTLPELENVEVEENSPLPLLRFQLSASNDSAPSPGFHDHIIEEWKGQFLPTIGELASGFGSDFESHSLQLDLPSGESLEIEITKNTQYAEGRGVFSGSVTGSVFSEVIFSYVNQAVSGSIMMPKTGQVIEIKNAGKGLQYLAMVDTAKLGACEICMHEKGETN